MATLVALRAHTTHDSSGTVITHDEGSSYELDDEGIIETLVAIGFAKRAEPVVAQPAAEPSLKLAEAKAPEPASKTDVRKRK